MAKKLKISSIFKKRETPGAAATWQWPSCTHSKTLSFRADDNIFKTINSVFFDPFDGTETSESFFTNSSSDQSLASNCISTESHEEIIKGVRSERLFFEPGTTSSIFQEPKKICKSQQEEGENQEDDFPFKESIIWAMESKDPYLDFKKSMKEMVETQGIKDWENLQELLAWYLKMNGEVNHGFVLGAFVDLVMELVIPTTPSTTSDNSITSYSSAASSSFSCPSSPLSSLGHKEIEEQENEKSLRI
ncbi:transcription repressor OFP13-like [Lycium ferocissimum]|uniref:transcription repressor OFP13-like n=1 Tax=Lycium ferocissimum TaxID=112874 RepID=UPI002815A42F|nr:transcription repressor OFP13-like [Lycium ferocissimum]